MKIRSATLEYQGQVFAFTSKPVFGATGAWVLEDVTGWFGGVGVRTETTDRLGHGMFQQRAWRSSRALTLAATYIANEPDERLALQRALSGMLWGGDYGTLTVETDRALSCPVRLDGEVGIVENGTHGVTLQVPLVSTDPWLYGEPRSVSLRPVGTGIGLEYPWFSGGYVAPEPGVNLSRNPDFSTLSTIVGSGTMTTGGAAFAYVTGDGGLTVTPGTSTASSAYLANRSTPLGRWAGRKVTLSGTIHLDGPVTGGSSQASNNPARALNIGVESPTGTPKWDYASSVSAPNEAGDHTVSVSCLLPDDPVARPGWFIRAFNGSSDSNVVWRNVSITGQDTVKPEATSLVLNTTQINRVAQSFAIDHVTGEYYVGQPGNADWPDAIHRVGPDGTYLDSMPMEAGGHFNAFGVERDGDDVWVWYWWETQAMRIRYRAEAITQESEDVEVLPVYGTGSLYFYINGDTVSVQENMGGHDRQFRLYNVDEYKAGGATPITSVNTGPIDQAYQGHAHDGDHVYIHIGGSESDAIGVWRFAWLGGDPVVVRSNVLEGQERQEAEGIALDGENVVAGISTGPLSNRIANVARFPLTVFEDTPTPAGNGVLTYGTAIASNDTIRNEGNATAYPVVTVTGDFPGGVQLKVQGRSGSVTYPFPLTVNMPLRVDMAGSAWINGSNVTSSLLNRDFGVFKLAPNEQIKPSLSALQGGSGYAEVTVNDTFI